MGRNSKETIIGIVSGSTWHTAVSVAAESGIYAESLGPLSLQGDPVYDESIGHAELTTVDYINHQTTPTLVAPMRREGGEMKLIAGIFGDDTVTGAGPYTHTFNWQTDSAFFHTIAQETNDADIIEWPSVKPISWTLAPTGDGFMQHTFETIADTINIAGDATNDGTAFDAVTYLTTGLRVPFRELRFRINAQGGAGLGSGDVIELSNISLSVRRAYEDERVTEGVSSGAEYMTREPQRNGYDEIMLEFTVLDYETIALLDDLKDGTEYKADLYWARTVGGTAYTWLIELGRLSPHPQGIEATGGGVRYPLTRTFRAINPTSTPTGMATSNPIHMVVDTSDATPFE